MKWQCFHEIMTGMGNVGLLKQHSVLITQLLISLKSRRTELFEDPLEPPVYLYQIKIHSELGSYCNYYVYKNAKRPRQYSKIRYPCTLFISIKAQMTTMLIQFWTSTKQNLKSWTQQRRGLDVGIRLEPHGDGSTLVLRNNCESYLQMFRIKLALLIIRYTAGQEWHGLTNLLLCTDSEMVLSIKLFDVSPFQLCNHEDAHIILHLHVTHSSSQYHDNCP